MSIVEIGLMFFFLYYISDVICYVFNLEKPCTMARDNCKCNKCIERRKKITPA